MWSCIPARHHELAVRTSVRIRASLQRCRNRSPISDAFRRCGAHPSAFCARTRQSTAQAEGVSVRFGWSSASALRISFALDDGFSRCGAQSPVFLARDPECTPSEPGTPNGIPLKQLRQEPNRIAQGVSPGYAARHAARQDHAPMGRNYSCLKISPAGARIPATEQSWTGCGKTSVRIRASLQRCRNRSPINAALRRCGRLPTVHFRTAMSIIGHFSLRASGRKIRFPLAAQ
jgi:hypothetical protein